MTRRKATIITALWIGAMLAFSFGWPLTATAWNAVYAGTPWACADPYPTTYEAVGPLVLATALIATFGIMIHHFWMQVRGREPS